MHHSPEHWKCSETYIVAQRGEGGVCDSGFSLLWGEQASAVGGCIDVQGLEEKPLPNPKPLGSRRQDWRETPFWDLSDL